MQRIDTKVWAVILVLFGFFFFIVSSGLPSYTRLAGTFLLLPILFFLFRRKEKIDMRRYFIMVVLSIFGTFVWDTIGAHAWLWQFPDSSILFRIVGIPVEEFVWGVWLCTVVIGTYTSLPSFRKQSKTFTPFKMKELLLMGITFPIQLLIARLVFLHPVSYFGWVAFLSVLPALFLLLRRGERIDEFRLLITIGVVMGLVVLIDVVFIGMNAWFYNPAALLGRIGVIPIDDFLFGIFNTILVVGFYTSIPRHNPLKSKW